ncbi:MAG: hypothetical protein J6M33_00150, partial [Anaerovibrio sp.]|nr:hypothetical protein [Anaerovibrio sp.]
MELQAGKRWRLKNEDEYLLVQQGVVEVYAVTASQESYRQEYLFPLKAGQAVFPAFDEFGEIDILIYALEDCQLQVEKLANSSKETLYLQMQEWFKQLSCIKWVKSLADLGDNSLDQNGMMLDEDIASCSDLLKCFEEKQRIFSMLQGIRFLSADKRLERRQNIISHQKQRLVNDAIDNLLGEEEIFYEERNTEQRTKNLEEASFIIHLVQKSLLMGQSDISIPPERVKKLDSIGLIRRVAQKANVQLRLIKLEKNWYTKDCGTMIGY